MSTLLRLRLQKFHNLCNFRYKGMNVRSLQRLFGFNLCATCETYVQLLNFTT